MKFPSIYILFFILSLPFHLSSGEQKTTHFPLDPEMTGKAWVAQVRADYEGGKYREFLDKVQKSYQAPDSQQMLQTAEKSLKERTKNQEELNKMFQEFNTKVKRLKEERNIQLNELCKTGGSEPICLYIQDVVQGGIEETQPEDIFTEKALSHPLFLQVGRLLMESMLKDDIAVRMANNKDSVSSREELARQQLVLKLQLMGQLEDFAKANPNFEYSSAILEVVTAFPKQAARDYSMRHLRALAKGDILPKTAKEEKTAEIMKHFYEEMRESMHLLKKNQK